MEIDTGLPFTLRDLEVAIAVLPECAAGSLDWRCAGPSPGHGALCRNWRELTPEVRAAQVLVTNGAEVSQRRRAMRQNLDPSGAPEPADHASLIRPACSVM